MSKRLWALTTAAILPVSCVPEATPPPPPPAPAPPASTAPPAVAAPGPAPTQTAAPEPPPAPPVMVKLVDVTGVGTSVPVASRCDLLYVAVAKGTVAVAGQSLAKGDVLMASSFAAPGSAGPEGLRSRGRGHRAPRLFSSRTSVCGPHGSSRRPRRRRKDLAWAGGAMHARLDLEKDASPEVYVGRLEGTAPVAEHDHATSWEVLCAIEGSGTFTLDGIPKHIAGPVVVAVPPGRKHSWQPDAGAKLVAVQVYAPPGPEQRFKALSKP